MKNLQGVLLRGRSKTRSQEKRDLYKCVVARSDISGAFRACEEMLRVVPDFSNRLYYPLFVAIIVCYARPFSKNDPLGPLKKEWGDFPTDQMNELHKDILAARNSYIAHSDLAIRKVRIAPPGVQVEPIEFKRIGIGVGVETKYFPLERFRLVKSNCLHLGTRLTAEIERLLAELYGGMDLPKSEFELKFDEGL